MEYSLAELGRSLESIMDALEDWGRGYQEMVRSGEGGVGESGRRPGLEVALSTAKGRWGCQLAKANFLKRDFALKEL